MLHAHYRTTAALAEVDGGSYHRCIRHSMVMRQTQADALAYHDSRQADAHDFDALLSAL